ncbi:MAG: cytidine deaminase [Alphaproteobacteria bacterium]|nr:cytidine deaminase [Alphaproteobacteria bacterium]
MSDLDDMIKAARAVRDRAYAFYSHFPVGACIQAESGKLYVGCNIENAAYPHGMCAEAGAISAMIAGGDRRIRAVVVLAGGAELCSPCGGCRQQLAEFSKPTTPIHICGPEGLRQSTTMGELLPLAFGRHNLDDDAPDEDEEDDK